MTDPYSEGWDAHEVVNKCPKMTKIANPYRIDATPNRDADLWDEGWQAYTEFHDA
jgi:hypothetical protein